MAGLLDSLGLQNSLGSGGLLGSLTSAYGGPDRLQGLLLALGGHDQLGAALMQQAAQRDAGNQFGREFGSIYGGGQPQQTAPAGLPMARSMPSTTGKIYGNDEPSPLDPPSGQDRDLAIRTMLAEAGNQGPQGLNAVGSVIRNRAVAGNFGGDTPSGVVQAPSQFEPWNTPGGRSSMAAIDPNSPRYQAADQALTSAYAGNDPTMGATHFFAPKAQAALGRDVPSWGRAGGQDIGDHRFFGGAAAPQQIASAGGPMPAPQTTQITAGQQPTQMAQAAPQQPATSPRAMQIMRALQIPNLPEGQRKLGEMLLQQELQASAPAKPTDDIREYERTQRDPAFRQYLIDMKRAGATNVSTNVGGGTDKQFFDFMEKNAEGARTAAVGLAGLREARQALQSGAITGAGANQVLMLQKVGAAFGITDPAKIVNTETFRAAIAPQVSAVLKATVGTANISNTDREFAEKAAGGNITLDAQSIAKLLDIMERASVGQIKAHNARVNKIYPDAEKFARERAAFEVDVPESQTAAPPTPPQPRQAPDGNFYVPDPNRPGKYLRVVQ